VCRVSMPQAEAHKQRPKITTNKGGGVYYA